MSIPADALAVLTPALVAVLGAGMVAIGAWLKMKTKQWERMTEEARSNAAEAKTFSEGNRKLLEENRDHIMTIEKQSDGMNSQLRSIAFESAFKAGRLKGMLEQSGAGDTEELAKMENEFQDSIKIQSGVKKGP